MKNHGIKRGGKMEKAFGKDEVNVGALVPIRDTFGHKTHWKIEKFKGDFKSREEAVKAGAELFETLEFEDNCLLNTGINLLLTLGIGGSGTAWTNALAAIGIGDSATAADPTQTDLLAATNKTYKAMDANYPTNPCVSQQLVARSTFASGDANYVWNEIVLRNGVSSGTCLNRKVQAMGTKASGTSWVATLTITLS
jgi:hypothetical protein